MYTYLAPSLPLTLQQNKQSVDEDFEIEGEGHVLDVEEVVFHALHHLVNVFGVAKLNHTPRGDARLGLLQVLVGRGYGQYLVDEVLPFGAGAH